MVLRNRYITQLTNWQLQASFQKRIARTSCLVVRGGQPSACYSRAVGLPIDTFDTLSASISHLCATHFCYRSPEGLASLSAVVGLVNTVASVEGGQRALTRICAYAAAVDRPCEDHE